MATFTSGGGEIDANSPINEERQSLLLQFKPASAVRMAALCGAGNGHLKLIAQRLGVVIRHRGCELHLEGNDQALHKTERLLWQLYRSTTAGELSRDDIHLATLAVHDAADNAAPAASNIADAASKPGQNGAAVSAGKNGKHGKNGKGPDQPAEVFRTPRLQVRSVSEAQRFYMRALVRSEICFGIGPAGVGKTWLATAAAVQALKNGEVERIVLVRPAVEAGERLGFLPGDLSRKIEPYQKPLCDAIYEFLGRSSADKLMEEGTIEVAPLAYMRGRTLNNAFVLLDESQNATVEQMKMLLTRMGNGSRMVITGDPSQSDLPANNRSGLQHALKLLADMPGVTVARLDENSVVRHPLVRLIIAAYAADEQAAAKATDSRTAAKAMDQERRQKPPATQTDGAG